MKNFIILLSVILLIFGLNLTVQAQPLPGTYDSRDEELLPPLEPGAWKEVLPDGIEGQPGNLISAMGDDYIFGDFDANDELRQVTLQQVTLLSSPDMDHPFYEYQTLYNGGLLELYNDTNAPWYNSEDTNPSFLATLGIVKVITRKYVNSANEPTGEMAFILKAIAEFGEYPGFKAYIMAAFEKGTPDRSGTGAPDDPVIMSGNLSWVRIKIEGPRPGLNVAVDIKPGSCPNPLNIKSKGVLPVAILGTEDFDVRDIKVNSIKLMGVEPLRWSYEDVATPFEPFTGKVGAYDCNRLEGDGFLDLTLKFKRTEIVDQIKRKYGSLHRDQVIVLKLKGKLKDGTRFYGEDVIIIKKPGNSN